MAMLDPPRVVQRGANNKHQELLGGSIDAETAHPPATHAPAEREGVLARARRLRPAVTVHPDGAALLGDECDLHRPRVPRSPPRALHRILHLRTILFGLGEGARDVPVVPAERFHEARVAVVARGAAGGLRFAPERA